MNIADNETAIQELYNDKVIVAKNDNKEVRYCYIEDRIVVRAEPRSQNNCPTLFKKYNPITGLLNRVILNSKINQIDILKNSPISNLFCKT